MPRKKKPVDDTPICDPAYARRIDPVWMPGPVPPRFWEDETHRRDYLLWSANRLDLRVMEDFYRLRLSACYRRNYGGGLKLYWGEEIIEAVRDCFPEYDWKPWLFVSIPDGFWDSRANRRSYLDWLGERLGFRCPDDWYEVAVYDFLQNKGSGLMQRYRISPAAAVIGSIPRRKWCEWKFTRVPPGFWEVAENRHRYLRWVGKELGFHQAEDWYGVQTSDITGRHGSKLIHRYASLYDLMREFLPQLDWDQVNHHRPIQVAEILVWADAHYAKHGKWPTGDSGEIPGTHQTWRRIDRCLRDGFRGLTGRTSLARFLQEHRGVRLRQPPPDLSEKEILGWADAHFAAYGKWPTENSGPIAGTKETWGKIANSLLRGGRGLRRSSSLAQLLTRQRGVRNPQRLPPLGEQKVVTWANAYFKATGRWPRRSSGPIVQSSEETWAAVDTALGKGCRGLPGGSSLAKLLRKHGLK